MNVLSRTKAGAVLVIQMVLFDFDSRPQCSEETTQVLRCGRTCLTS